MAFNLWKCVFLISAILPLKTSGYLPESQSIKDYLQTAEAPSKNIEVFTDLLKGSLVSHSLNVEIRKTI